MDRRGYAYFFVLVVVVAAALVFLYVSGERGEAGATAAAIDDWDPTWDTELVVRLDRIRKLDPVYGEEPTLWMEITVDGTTVKDIGPWGGIDAYPRWRHLADVDDGKENVSIEIRLFEGQGENLVPCDVGPRSGIDGGRALHLTYSLRDGTWRGDDYRGDPSGYGRATGAEDGNLEENDYEVWFSVYQTDADGDRLTWYEETYVYGTDPLASDYHADGDGDGIPTWWEDHWGYHPYAWDDHATLDPDNDGLNNLEEYRMADYGADPFRQDIFVEVDFMENMLLGTTTLPEYSKQQVISAFTRRNMALHIDDGLMGGGGEVLPYVRFFTPEQLARFYRSHFLHYGEQEWRAGIFRYCVIAQYALQAAKDVAGYSWWPTNEDKFNCFVVAQRVIKNYRWLPQARATATGSLFMHELGHTLGIFWHTYHGCDNMTTIYPWLPGWSEYENYLSCMNYRYAWSHIDYSDGSHGPGDFDDWSHVDPAFFEKKFFAAPPIILSR
ncbi:MAG: hypothetical protein PHZ19_03355 [Candidatus Thermoplasmatota archaeon]|nr:hypothetical protein [Candidatus Thermoplasmatota archaeon]